MEATDKRGDVSKDLYLATTSMLNSEILRKEEVSFNQKNYDRLTLPAALLRGRGFTSIMSFALPTGASLQMTLSYEGKSYYSAIFYP